MRTIRDSVLFDYLTRVYDENGDLWKALFDDTTPKIEFERWTQLDHIEVKKGGFYFIDVGTNDKDGSFVIRPCIDVGEWTDEDEAQLRELRRRKARFLRDKGRKRRYSPKMRYRKSLSKTKDT